MADLNIEKFSPTVAELKSIVVRTSKIDTNDLTEVEKGRKELGEARIDLNKVGKGMRASALLFQKEVIAKEKELLAIVVPEEDRLKEILTVAAEAAEIEARKAVLPHRIKQCEEASLKAPPEEELLKMDDEMFAAWKSEATAEKNEKDRLKLEADRKEVDDAKAKLVHDKEVLEAKEKGIDEERERQDKEAEEEEERKKQEAKDKKAKEAADKRNLQRQENYRAFRVQCGWTEELKHEFKEERDGDIIILWRQVGTFKLDK